jgi:hypothetical protein
MLRLFAAGVVLAALGTLVAAPVPADMRKPAAFPAGHYVLAGASEAAQGDDVYEFTKTFRLKPGQYVLSGGPKPTDLILVDDDLEVYQEKTALFLDNDTIRSTETRGKQAAKYQGRPIVLVLDPTKKLRIVAIDYHPTSAAVGPLWLHRWDGAAKKLTEGKSAESAPVLPATFFDQSFALGDGFEMPEKVSTDAAIEVPEKPASMLPRFKRPAPPAPPAPVQPVRADAPSVPDASEFLQSAIASGLEEDGVTLTLASDLAKRDDFLGKCSICGPSRKAFAEYGSRRVQPKAAEGKGLPEELVKRLKSDKAEVRQPALRDLVARYMERAYAKSNFTTEQKTALQAKLEQWRKDMSGALPAGQKFCPSCDGATCRGPKL